MSRQTSIVEQFTHLIEQGQRLSHEEIADHSFKMMQKMASSPAQRLAWQSLKEALEVIYYSLEDDNQYLGDQSLNSHIVNQIQRITR